MFRISSRGAGKVVGTVAVAAGVLIGSGSTPASAELYSVDDVVYAAAPTIDEFWVFMLEGTDVEYEMPEIVYYNTPEDPGSIDTACGEMPLENAAYCTGDFTIYLDYQFLDEAIAAKGDFAAALVIAHEWAHHIENGIGMYGDGSDLATIQTELLADCFAGTVAAYWDDLGMIEEGDLEEGYEMVVEIADMPGTDPLDPTAHGDADARLAAFFSGYELASPEACFQVVDEIFGELV